MKTFQRDFIRFAIEQGVLKFGQFQLKSGRISPYFFNAGLFNSGQALAAIGDFYASAIQDYQSENPDFTVEMLFGPAYKGIPLVSTTAVSLFNNHQRSLPYAFNRKEAKDHGEGGSLVGAPLKGNILIVDDVITAGTAIRESVKLINSIPGANFVGVIVALDRQEKGQNAGISAIQEVEKEFGVKVISIVRLADILSYLQEIGGHGKQVEAILEYRTEYGI